MYRKQRSYSWCLRGIIAGVLAAIALLAGWLPAQATVPPVTFADPAQYPIQQVPGDHYRPVADWVGRLILPEPQMAQADAADWVWLEVYHSPQSQLIGQRLRLQWQDRPELQALVSKVTRSIEFDQRAIVSAAKGNVHPTRLNGWSQVGPLQSLAGARPQDTVVVSLAAVEVLDTAAGPALAIGTVPIQVPERYYGVVHLLAPEANRPAPADCPDGRPCPSDYFQVQHYNPATQAFDGDRESIRIPQVPANSNGIFQSTPRALAQSPAGEAGWYVYGARDREGVFVVRAIAPRRLFQIQPETTLQEPGATLNYINFGNWRDTPARKGTLQSVLLDPAGGDGTEWREGDRALVIHLFGGIGGEKAEPKSVVATVTGHFAYGLAQVIRDSLTQELRFEVIYDQIYSHNPLGIVAGRVTWAEFAGNLRRGWLGVRPISDALVKLPALTRTYTFGETTLDPFAEFQRQLVIMMARYRTGDGTGAAIVTPAQSCVQDSSQALYETIQQLSRQVSASPEIQQWLAENPKDLQTLQFQELLALGHKLEQELVPLGIVRPDWQENSEVLAGVRPADQLGNKTNLITQLLSWRTVIPRVAYDEVAAIFLEHGAEIWVLRTNQVGGQDTSMIPLAPTELFGQSVVAPTLFSRLFESLRWPTWSDLGITLLGLVTYGAIANPHRPLPTVLLRGLRLSRSPLHRAGGMGVLLVPALLEELGFRVLLLPHPTEAVLPVTGLIWSGVSVILFVIYRLSFKERWQTPQDPPAERSHQLFLTILLGLMVTVIYLSTGSLIMATGFHWGTGLVQQRSLIRQPTTSLLK